jgi:hypothetical protein
MVFALRQARDGYGANETPVAESSITRKISLTSNLRPSLEANDGLLPTVLGRLTLFGPVQR